MGHILPSSQLPMPHARQTRTSRRETARSPARPPPSGDGRAPIYTAVNCDAALEELERFDHPWGTHPMIAAPWRTVCDHITPFLSLAADLRKAAPHPNTIEALRR
jgi:hypothetical protein